MRMIALRIAAYVLIFAAAFLAASRFAEEDLFANVPFVERAELKRIKQEILDAPSRGYILLRIDLNEELYAYRKDGQEVFLFAGPHLWLRFWLTPDNLNHVVAVLPIPNGLELLYPEFDGPLFVIRLWHPERGAVLLQKLRHFVPIEHFVAA